MNVEQCSIMLYNSSHVVVAMNDLNVIITIVMHTKCFKHTLFILDNNIILDDFVQVVNSKNDSSIIILSNPNYCDMIAINQAKVRKVNRQGVVQWSLDTLPDALLTAKLFNFNTSKLKLILF